MNPSDWNGAVVKVLPLKLIKILPTHGALDLPPSQRLGISFVTNSDLTALKPLDKTYVHVIFKNLYFCRIPICALKIVNKKVTVGLRRKVFRRLRDYLHLGFLSNLSYLEAYKNIKDMRTR